MSTKYEQQIFEVSINSVHEVVRQIRKDIYELSKKARPADIKIAIPLHYQKILRLYINGETIYPVSADFREYFGAEVVLGYNNQICVFNERAVVESDFCPPIYLTYN